MIERGTFHQPHRGGGRGLRDVLHQQILRPGEQEDHVGAGRHGGGGAAGDGGEPPAVCEPDPGGVQPAGQGTEDRNSEGPDPAVQGSLLPVVAELEDS